MGNRQSAETVDTSEFCNYKYPPRQGNYFGCHFIMGGERFDTPQPEAYLFGENADLNFLGSPAPKPIFQFPYPPPPPANELTKTLKSLVNIRKESVRFVKAVDSVTQIHGNITGNKGYSFNVEFILDSDVKCSITINYFCTEEIGSNGITYVPRDSSLTSETYHYGRGINQLFSQHSHIFNPNLFSEEDLCFNSEKDVFPVVIHCVVEGDEARQSHTTICVVDQHPDGSYSLRALKQKIFIDGLCYLLQEIYGIENKIINRTTSDDDTEDSGSECVICMCDTRDTLILPCRHLCLCNSCADSLRYQANNCPICRAPFRALLQIRAVQKSTDTNIDITQNQEGTTENIPEGYIGVSLIEALNGPIYTNRNSSGNDDNTDNDVVLAAEMLNRNNDKNAKQTSPKSHHRSVKDKVNQNTPEFRMSVLLSKEDCNITKELLTKHSPLMNRAPVSRDKNPREKGSLRPQAVRDCVKIVNEKNLANLQNENQENNDDDSDNEKLSPLLNAKLYSSPLKNDIDKSALHMDGVEEPIDDTDSELEEHETNTNNDQKKICRPILPNIHSEAPVILAEDSDFYYTPEDPATTILDPKRAEDKTNKNDIHKYHLSSPLVAIKESVTSLPDSPISGNSTSTHSSGDSYSSSSSTKQLLVSISLEDDLNRTQDVTEDDDNKSQMNNVESIMKV